MKTSRRLGLLMIISGATLWGFSGPIIQWLFQETAITSIDFLIIRLLLAGVILLAVLAIRKQPIFAIWKDPRQWIQLVIFGIIGMLGAQYAFIETVRISNAVTATLFQFLGPVLITVYVAIQYKKLPTFIQMLSILVALSGIFFLITNGSIENIILTKIAIIFGLLTAIGFTFYTLQPAALIKKWGSPLIVGWGMLLAGVALLLCNRQFSFLSLAKTLSFETSTMLFLAILSGTLSFVLYIGSLKHLSAMETSLLSSIEPLVAVIVSIIWLNESFGGYQLIGGGLIVAAVAALSLPEKELGTVARERVS